MNNDKPLRIVLVEDIKDVREGFKYFLSLEPNFTVVKAYENARELFDDLENGLKTDVVLMDIELPKMNGIEATGTITRLYPNIAVLILTIFEEERKILAALRSGARGYILKNTKPHVLVDQIKCLADGGSPISPSIAGTLITEIQKTTPPTKKDYSLTTREKQILENIVEGMTCRDIAHKYSISLSTSKKHVLHIYQKLNVKSKVEIVKKVINEGLI